MKKQFRKVLPLVLAFSLTSVVSAQITGGGTGSNIQIFEWIIQIVSWISGGDVQSMTGVFKYLISLGALGHIVANVLGPVLVKFQSNLLEDSSSIGSGLKSGDSYPWSVKGASFLAAAATLWYIPGTPLLLVIGIVALSILTVLFSTGGSFWSVIWGGAKKARSQLPGGSGENERDSKEESKLQEQIKKLQKELEDLKNKEDTTESQEQSGEDEEIILKELVAEVEELEDIGQEIERIETEFEELLEERKEEEEAAFKEEREAWDELEEVEEIEKQVFQDLQNFLRDLKAYKDSSQPEPDNWEYEEAQIAQELQSQIDQLRELEQAIEMEADVNAKINSLTETLNNLKEELSELTQEIEELEALEKELEDAENKEEQLIKQYGNQGEFENLEEVEEETRKAAKTITNIVEMRKRLESELEEEVQKLEEEKRIESQEIQEIQQILQEIQAEDGELQQLRNWYADRKSDSHFNLNDTERELFEKDGHIHQVEKVLQNVQQEAEAFLKKVNGRN